MGACRVYVTYIFKNLAVTPSKMEGVGMNPIQKAIEAMRKKRRAQAALFGLPAWAQALVGVLVAVLFISLFYGIVVWVGGTLANVIQNTPGGNTNVGTGANSVSPYQAFVNLFQYVFTVGSFTGVAIILAVVAVIFVVFYYLLGGGASGAIGGR